MFVRERNKYSSKTKALRVQSNAALWTPIQYGQPIAASMSIDTMMNYSSPMSLQFTCRCELMN